jgi:hypothetical protein
MQIDANTNDLEGTCVLSGQFSPIIYGVLDNCRTTTPSEDWWWCPRNMKLNELKICNSPEFVMERGYSVFRNW